MQEEYTGLVLIIAQTSAHKDLVWKLIESSLDPDILDSFLSQKGLLPTQISMETSDLLNVTA
jgi:hypothetical protein